MSFQTRFVCVALLAAAPGAAAQGGSEQESEQGKAKQEPAKTAPPAQEQRPAIPTDRRGGRVLRLSLADCMRLGDTSNVDLTLSKLQELLGREDVNLADSVFEPEFFMVAEWMRSESPPRNTFQPSITSKVYRGSVGLRKLVVTGGSLELALSPSYIDQVVNSPFSFPNTVFTGDLSFTLSQPLLRGAWVDYNLADYEAAKREQQARRSDYERARQTVLDAISTAYYNLIFAREDWVVRYQGLALAREQLRNTEKKIELGELAPRDRVADQADVARKEEELIVAEQGILDAEDVLRRLILPFRGDESWGLVVIPTDELDDLDPELPLPELSEAYETARRNRPDLVAGRKRVEATMQQLLKAERDLLPGLDFTAIYSAAAQTEDGGAFTGDVLAGEFPAYTLRLGLLLPIGNLAARSAYRKAKLTLEEAQRNLQILRIDIEQDVREVIRSVETLRKSIAAARESVRLEANNLESVQIKVRLGSESPFEIQRRSQDLQDAKSRLIRARLDYRIAWFNLQAVLGMLRPDTTLPRPAEKKAPEAGAKEPATPEKKKE